MWSEGWGVAFPLWVATVRDHKMGTHFLTGGGSKMKQAARVAGNFEGFSMIIMHCFG